MPQTGQTANATRVTRKELERRLHAQEVELRGLSAKLARSRKKRQRLQRVVDAGVGLDESTDAIPYPTGEVPGRGDCQLIDIIGVDKATYNAFAMCVRDAAVAAGIPKTSRWNNVPPVALGEVLDMVREQYPWLAGFKNDWPATSVLKQFLRNNRNSTSRRRRNAQQMPAA